MSEEYSPEELKMVRNFLRGMYEDSVIAQFETDIALTPDVPVGAPDPNSCHPAFSHAADFVRNFNRDHVVISMIDDRDVIARDDPIPQSLVTKRLVLTRQRCFGLAPFVGDPFSNDARYFWNIWVDDRGRYIAGDSTLIWRFE